MLHIRSLLETVYDIQYNHYGNRFKKYPKNAQGIEIEVETNEPHWNVPEGHGYSLDDYWKVKRDGSLRRNGAEFILQKPLHGAELLKSIIEIHKTFSQVKIFDSIRTSTHVHHNVQDKTGYDLVNIFALYWIVEDLLLDFCGKHRKGNYNCLSISQTNDFRMGIEDWLKSIYKNPEAKSNLIGSNTIYSYSSDNYRYSALSPKPLVEFGSIEFRGMRCLTNKDDIWGWSRIIQKLFSYQEKNPRLDTVLANFDRMTPKEIIHEIFEEFAPSLIKTGCNDWEEELSENLMKVVNLKNALFTWDYKELEGFYKLVQKASEEYIKNNPSGSTTNKFYYDLKRGLANKAPIQWNNHYPADILREEPPPPVPVEPPRPIYERPNDDIFPLYTMTQVQEQDLLHFFAKTKIFDQLVQYINADDVMQKNLDRSIFSPNIERLNVPGGWNSPAYRYRAVFANIKIKYNNPDGYLEQHLPYKVQILQNNRVIYEHTLRTSQDFAQWKAQRVQPVEAAKPVRKKARPQWVIDDEIL